MTQQPPRTTPTTTRTRRARTTPVTTPDAPAAPTGSHQHHTNPAQALAPDPASSPDINPARTARALLARLPLYQQIAEDLRARITAGDLPPGAALPSETEMITQYGVSRITVRHAVAALRASGLVDTSHGRATTVRTTNPDTLAITFDPVITRHDTGWTTWDNHDWTDAEPPSRYRTTAANHGPALALASAEPVFILERLLTNPAGAHLLHRVIVPFATATDIPTLTSNPFRTPTDLYQHLTTAGHVLTWTDTTRAVMPTPDDTAALNIGDGIPLLIHTRTTHNTTGRPLALEETRLPADRATITGTATSTDTGTAH